MTISELFLQVHDHVLAPKKSQLNNWFEGGEDSAGKRANEPDEKAQRPGLSKRRFEPGCATK